MSTKRVRDMTCGAMHEFAIALDKAGFSAKLVQQIVNSTGNEYAKMMHSALIKVISAESRFELINTFDLVVPGDYDHQTHLDMFREQHVNEFVYYDRVINDNNYKRATTNLVSGRKFKVMVFQIKETVSADDCLTFLRSQEAVLVGAQGASLVYQEARNKLPNRLLLPLCRWSASFDEGHALPVINFGGYFCGLGVPGLFHENGGFGFGLKKFEDNLDTGCCLLCFCDAE